MNSSGESSRTIKMTTAALYAAILVLFQLLLTQWTIKAAGQREIIDFISFAGTLTSMLLAVLAIVYSYYTTTSQKNDADRIATQIGSLTTTVSTLDRSETRLSNELTKLSEIRLQLDEVGDRVRSSSEISAAMHESVERTHESVERMRAELQEKAAAAATSQDQTPSLAQPEHSFLTYAKKLIEGATDYQIPYIFAALSKLGSNLTFDQVIEQYVLSFSARSSKFVEYVAFGEIHAYVMVLLDLQVMHDEQQYVGFVRAFKTRAEKLPTEDDADFKWSRLTPFMNAELSKLDVRGFVPRPRADPA